MSCFFCLRESCGYVRSPHFQREHYAHAQIYSNRASSHLNVQLYPETLFCSTFWLFSPPLDLYDNNGFPMMLEFDDHRSYCYNFYALHHD